MRNEFAGSAPAAFEGVADAAMNAMAAAHEALTAVHAIEHESLGSESGQPDRSGRKVARLTLGRQRRFRARTRRRAAIAGTA
jgi:hypothetical protein